MTVYKRIGLNVDWTIGPLNHWTIFWDHFFRSCFGPFFLLDHFIGGGGGPTISA